MALRLAAQALGLSAGILLSMAALSDAADSRKLEAAGRGRLILQQNCGRCHAIEAVGDSPLKNAPPMRDIYFRFHPQELQERLTEGLGSKHKQMPQIQFSDEDTYAIMTYLYALAVKLHEHRRN
jgi:mono/diheme cytochrome c family protein